MELERSVPSRNILTGFEVEEQSFTWTISNYPVVRLSKTMIEAQSFDFTAGETTGHPSQWTVYLTERTPTAGGKRWIRIQFKPKSPHPTDAAFNNAHSRIRFTIRNQKGEVIEDDVTLVLHIATVFAQNSQWGFPQFIDADDENLCPEGNLAIEVSFKLYTPPPRTLEGITEKFQVRFMDQLQKDFAGLLETSVPCTDIKIVASDKEEFTMQRGILAVRSEVFAAMLSSDMIEANSGVIHLPDISSKALKVLYNYLYTGKLLPEWRDSEVILELTNAAAKYQLRDLFQFLDQTLGKVCKLDNAVPLLVLARQLSLKVAEEELMLFARKEWMGSAESFLQMLNSLTTDEADEPEAKKQKLN